LKGDENMDNKFFQPRLGDLANVGEVSIVDEPTFKKDLEEEKWKIKKRWAFTTTMGDYDPDHFNWMAYLIEVSEITHEDTLILVRSVPPIVPVE